MTASSSTGISQQEFPVPRYRCKYTTSFLSPQSRPIFQRAIPEILKCKRTVSQPTHFLAELVSITPPRNRLQDMSWKPTITFHPLVSIRPSPTAFHSISRKPPAGFEGLVSTSSPQNGLQSTSWKPSPSQGHLVSITPPRNRLQDMSWKPTITFHPLVSIRPSPTAFHTTSRKPRVQEGQKRAARTGDGQCRSGPLMARTGYAARHSVGRPSDGTGPAPSTTFGHFPKDPLICPAADLRSFF